ncbi:oxidoreductase [Desulfosporosinus nitroreducens]|uniref:oxidoreductase n=1 Tax=Desulfosporosinus nitroreducens TaxID=2018668 RepID=UPI00207C4E8B|nr:hypothetical protein [Desulfosporosinus nitroreducens]MCO1603137.1 hypothetical protein [Desulfosporosinus nitroreducens]
MKTLFDQTTIKHLDLSNRFIRSATWEGLASTDGGVTTELIEAMVELAKGGVGLIITGHSYVRRDGQAGPNQLGIYSDSLIPGLKEMTKGGSCCRRQNYYAVSPCRKICFAAINRADSLGCFPCERFA